MKFFGRSRNESNSSWTVAHLDSSYDSNESAEEGPRIGTHELRTENSMTHPPRPNWEDVKRDYPVGAMVTGTVVHRAVFGVFVQIPNCALGLIVAPEISKDKSLKPEDFPEVGEKISARVAGYRDSNQQVALTMLSNS